MSQEGMKQFCWLILGGGKGGNRSRGPREIEPLPIPLKTFLHKARKYFKNVLPIFDNKIAFLPTLNYGGGGIATIFWHCILKLWGVCAGCRLLPPQLHKNCIMLCIS